MSEHTIPSARAGNCTAIMVHHNYHSKSHSSAMKRAQELSRWCKVHIVISKFDKSSQRNDLNFIVTRSSTVLAICASYM